MKRIELSIINDHIAFSFPIQLPNNVLQMGGAALKPRPLGNFPRDQLKDLKVRSQGRSVLFLSVGSYIDFSLVPSHMDILESLVAMDNVAVVIKVSMETQFDWLPADRFYRTTWAPQRDLLASGQITLFVSHCGNNGRIETIYYGVPVLCLPIFADQSMNGYLVRRRGFGELLLPSQINRDSFTGLVGEMLEDKARYSTALTQAREIFESEPATGTEKLLYYVNLLLRQGDLKFLRNELLAEQSFVEVHNLDVLGVVVTVVIMATALCVWCILLVVRRIVQYHGLIIERVKKCS
eukprot:sb/3467523/